ncbi:hypothetical protein CYMTET_43437 [Cymbomonas tetramitiformis]|uniref:Kinesin-like protein n=1 Tax=Cymbomonas tetramitiformis TaxID=36881 RepID=A0AAE0F0M3_9CHLO|nr:hypothetical protein CYMTET_43437 [Cymbomonas tetramitiformis]
MQEMSNEASVALSAEVASKSEQIWVGVRLRPLNDAEKRSRNNSCWHVTSATSLKQSEVLGDRVSKSSITGDITTYTFDRVFSAETDSTTVYNDAAQRIVISGMQGINGTIFAYGQTSSGKTHTMKSIVSSGIKEVFEHIHNTPSREFLLHIAAMEIYNEVCRDLLKDSGASVRLLDDPERGTVAEGLTEEPVRSLEHLLQLVADAETRRQVGAHALNRNSSRSHQIIRLTIESRIPNKPTPAASAGGVAECSGLLLSSLNFVDLAGSERYSGTGANGQRLKEGCHINQSLLALGKVIRALTDGKSVAHVPYRDSKLTRILQHSLGGNARTAIVCTVSPAIEHLDQSKKTLGFAAAAKMVVNCAQVNEVQDDKALILRYQAEIAQLQEALAIARRQGGAAPASAHLQEQEQHLSKVEGEMRGVAAAREQAERRLRNLNNFILRAPSMASSDGERNQTLPVRGRALRGSWARTSWQPQHPLAAKEGSQPQSSPLYGLDLRASWAAPERRARAGCSDAADHISVASDEEWSSLSAGVAGFGGILPGETMLLDLVVPGLRERRRRQSKTSLSKKSSESMREYAQVPLVRLMLSLSRPHPLPLIS